MENKAPYRSSQNFGILAVSMGIILVFVALIGGVSIAVAIAKGIMGHTLSGIRSGVVSLFFDLIAPLIGGIILVLAGLRVLRMDKLIINRDAVSDNRRQAVKEKERIINIFLNNDEKKIMTILKGDPEGSLQSNLVIKTGYSKVKMHRILKSLENKGLIKRGRFGITNRVLLSSQ